ncbi:MAG: polysaccharide deacetylase family protein [Clostridia bacterium]|nr:polysaccharide deacetylase family protein [Clostridia bacterium]
MNLLRKTLPILLVMTFILSSAIYASGETTCHWYIKHRKGEVPQFPPEANTIEQYDGYYIDNKLSQSSETKRLYLTFDAGYENGNIEKILNILKEKNVPAAFFLLDNIILKNTDLVLRMGEEGHLVCNHTKNHKNLSNASEEEIAKNLTALEKIYEEKCGREMSKYFRFPEGNYSIEALKCVQKLGYKTVFWSFAYDDWDNGRQMSNEKATKKILDNTHNGAIILLHPTSETNTEILPTLIEEWRAMGYSFGTLDELTS